METLVNCPICKTSSFEKYLTCKDYLVSANEFTIQQCLNCGFRFTSPRPTSDEIGSYYKSNQYISHNDGGSGLVDVGYRLVRSYALHTKVNLISKLVTGQERSVLDMGCGTGAFLHSCQNAGWQITGVEPDADANAIAQAKLKKSIPTDLNALVTDQQYDIITLWHVLEHVPDLNHTIALLHSLLKPEGYLIIAVPNSDSYDAHYFKSFWAAYDVPRHLYHFTPRTIETLFENHQFKLKEKKPMLFDAFYIGLLSTRYQSGKSDYIQSIRVGLQSNYESVKTGNASSQLYIFNKV